MRHSELVVLGLLQPGPRHGYEIVREIDSMQVDRWARIGRSTVYKVLRRLEERGALERSLDREGRRPERQVYELTEAGRERLRELASQALASSQPAYSDRVVGAVFAALAMPRDEAREALREARDRAAEAGARLDAAADRADSHGSMVIDFLRRVARAERRLLEDELERLDAEGAVPPPELGGPRASDTG